MGPRFAVVVPVHDPPERVLHACLASVRAQTFPDWELCLVDDGSTSSDVRSLLAHVAASDPRVRLTTRATNGGIVAASNGALAAATGEFVTFLDHDDTLETTALEEVDRALRGDATIDYLYTDEDVILPNGRLGDPFYKPDWSPERERSQNYCCHLSVVRRSVVDAVGRFRPGFAGSQDHDLILRVTERARTIAHLPRVLYHWRTSPTSVAANMDAKPYALEAGRRAVAEHCDRIGIPASVTLGDVPGTYRLRRRVQGEPLVSVVIPTRGTRGRVWGVERCFVLSLVEDLVQRTTYDRLEVVVVADADTPAPVVSALGRIGGEQLQVVRFDGPFNFAEKVNRGASAARGEHLLLLNDDVEVITPDFVETMLALDQDDGVGMVGAKLLYEDGTLQHAGHVYNGGPRHAYYRHPSTALGVRGLLQIERECSGVTAACAMVRTSVFAEVGGLSPRFPNNFNDVDMSSRVREAGYRIVWTPYAQLYHFESKSRDPSVANGELDLLFRRWPEQMAADPYYNPNLAPHRADWVERPFR